MNPSSQDTSLSRITRISSPAFLALIGSVILTATPIPATGAGRSCAPHEDVVRRLASTYGETRKSIGLAQENSVVEIFTSDESGTWTITVTDVSGVTCLIASGQAFETLDEPLRSNEKEA